VRAWEATGRADARLVAAAREVIDAETDTSTGTRSRLIRRVTKAVEATYGPGVVPKMSVWPGTVSAGRCLVVRIRGTAGVTVGRINRVPGSEDGRFERGGPGRTYDGAG
jgi:hypothetical protein